jgi:putative ATP-dependent endonuclease of the OLD family
MRLVRVLLRNFRCHKTSTEVAIDQFTALIGRGDAGKSTILEALQVFFDNGTPDGHDASKDGDKKDCCIACEFDELPESIVIDSTYHTTLKDEFLLNENGRLEIHKIFNCEGKPKLLGTYIRALHPTAEGMNDLLTLTITQLKKRAEKLKAVLTDVNLTVNAAIRKAIWATSTDRKESLVDVEITGDPILDQLSKAMPLFQLFKSDRPSTDQDAEAQDPMKVAVREALKSRQSELDEIAQRVQDEVKSIAMQTVAKVKEMDPTLANELHPEFQIPKWDGVFKITLTGDEEIPVNKRGSGVRRLILLNFFRARAESLLADDQH